MALSGSFAGTTANSLITTRIDWSAEQSVLGNYSTITVKLYYLKVSYSTASTYGTLNGTIKIGSYSQNYSKYVTISPGGEVLVATFTQKVYHDDAGELSVTISATGAITDTTLTSTTISSTVTLDTIARAATIAATDANIGSASVIAVSAKSSAYTHSIRYQFGSLSGYIGGDGHASDTEVKHSATSILFVIPEDFYAEIPADRSGKCTLTCTTYSGDTVIGTNDYQFTATAAESECKPDVSGTVVDTNEATISLTGDENVLVRYASTALCTITAEAKNGASIKTKMVNGVAMEDTLTIEAVEVSNFIFYALDTRNYPASVSVTKTLIPYIKPTCKASVQRTDPTSGNAILTVEGKYYKGSFGAAENELTVTYSVNGGEPVEVAATFQDDTYTVSAEIEGLDYLTSHSIEVVVEDALSPVHRTCTVKKGIPVFDWGENDFCFNVPVYDQDGNVFATVNDLSDYALDESLKDYVRTDSMGAYVTAEYTSGSWKVRKWSNGECELWTTCEATVASMSAWGSMYICPSVIQAQTYPVTFMNPPLVQATPQVVSSTVYGIYAGAPAGTTTASPGISVWRGGTASSFPVRVDLYVKGILA